MPCCAKIAASNLMSWPIFKTLGSSSSGFSLASVSRSGICFMPFRLRGERQRIGAFGDVVAERDIAGMAGRERQRDADEFRARVIEGRRLGADRDETLLMRRRDPAIERRRILDQLVALLDRRRRSGCGR